MTERPRFRPHDHPRRSGAGDPRMGPRWVHSRQSSRRGRPAAPAAPARGSTKREDKDSLTVGSLTAIRRLGSRREDKDSPEFLIFPHSTTPPRRLPRLPRLRRAMSAFSPLVDPEAQRATGGKGMVTFGHRRVVRLPDEEPAPRRSRLSGSEGRRQQVRIEGLRRHVPPVVPARIVQTEQPHRVVSAPGSLTTLTS